MYGYFLKSTFAGHIHTLFSAPHFPLLVFTNNDAYNFYFSSEELIWKPKIFILHKTKLLLQMHIYVEEVKAFNWSTS